ncbi:MAG: Gldg family protein [Myxococcota bacterium]|jgi:hypothetical protein|nr:hypothetical protein [Deltaproteobacteria bacterium]MCP4241211.1 hypothetical protein [bacterium]MDP6075077.1 Gldg family protein [Myxococcota bacterium]MDP6242499.1 Gldg family protein [Myxococcota bacterium]MDP7074813.1 Gldg family protein [Myxococcota bacterium]
MRELGFAGLVAVLTGLGSYYTVGELALFSVANLVAGALALLVALGTAARRLRAVGGPHSRKVAFRGIAWIAAAVAGGVALEQGAAWTGVRFDWTLEESFEISPAVRKKLDEIHAGGDLVTATLYFDPGDPRVRRTRLLLEEIERVSKGELVARERNLLDHPDDADLFGIGSSNTVVLTVGDFFETVPRPTEGTLYEALYLLHGKGSGTLIVLRGEGEGNIERSDELGFSGLAAALQTEGYRLESHVSAGLREVPEATAAVLAVAPQRRLLPGTLAALRRYLESGGSLVAMLAPGTESGLEELLAEWGIEAVDGIVVDPRSAPVTDDSVAAVNVVAFNYEVEPVTLGLESNRMTYFPGVRPFTLRRPEVDDRVRRAVLSSSDAWVTEDVSWLARSHGTPERDGQATGYQTLVATGRYPRPGGETRIVAIGNATFASNRWLRTLYNLDLVLNAVHWATEQTPAVTLRPKIRSTVQFPLPINNSVQALYSVGLLLPELLLITGGIIWLRRRAA